MGLDASKLIEGLIQERRFLKDVTPATVEWYRLFTFITGTHGSKNAQ